jgi:hypothetical protein
MWQLRCLLTQEKNRPLQRFFTRNVFEAAEKNLHPKK